MCVSHDLYMKTLDMIHLDCIACFFSFTSNSRQELEYSMIYAKPNTVMSCIKFSDVSLQFHLSLTKHAGIAVDSHRSF